LIDYTIHFYHETGLDTSRSLLESQTVDLSLFYFSFYFHSLFNLFYFKKLGLGFSVTLHVTVKNCHMTRPSVTHQSQKSHGTIEDSRRF